MLWMPLCKLHCQSFSVITSAKLNCSFPAYLRTTCTACTAHSLCGYLELFLSCSQYLCCPRWNFCSACVCWQLLFWCASSIRADLGPSGLDGRGECRELLCRADMTVCLHQGAWISFCLVKNSPLLSCHTPSAISRVRFTVLALQAGFSGALPLYFNGLRWDTLVTQHNVSRKRLDNKESEGVMKGRDGELRTWIGSKKEPGDNREGVCVGCHSPSPHPPREKKWNVLKFYLVLEHHVGDPLFNSRGCRMEWLSVTGLLSQSKCFGTAY